MATVVQIQRQPNGWDTFGNSIQQTSDNFLKSMLAMGQMQNNNAWRMAEMNMQNQRLADANARQDKQLAAVDARSKEELAQRLQMHNDTMALHRQQIGIAMGKLSEERAARERINDLFKNPGGAPNGTGAGSGGMGAGYPGLDQIVNSMRDDVLSPSYTPGAMGGQSDATMFLPGAVGVHDSAPAFDTSQPINAELIGQAGFQTTKPQPTMVDLAQRSGLWPLISSHTPTPGSAADKDATMSLVVNGMKQSLGIPLEQRTEAQRMLAGLAPALGVQLDTPAAAPADSGMGANADPSTPTMLEQPKRPEPANINGFTVANFPPQLAMYPGGKAVFETLKERDAAADNKYKLDVKAWESQQKQAQTDQANMEKQNNSLMLANSAIRSADQSLKLLDNYGRMATGSLAREWLKDGTWGRSLGLAQGMDNLEEAMKPMKTVSMMEMIDQLKKQNTNGALGMRITQLEAMMMSGVFGSLETSQTPDQLRASILAHKKIYSEIQQIAQEIQRNKGRGGSYSPTTAPAANAAPAASDGWEDI